MLYRILTVEKVFDSWIKDLRCNLHLYKKSINRFNVMINNWIIRNRCHKLKFYFLKKKTTMLNLIIYENKYCFD